MMRKAEKKQMAAQLFEQTPHQIHHVQIVYQCFHYEGIHRLTMVKMVLREIHAADDHDRAGECKTMVDYAMIHP